MSQIDLQSELLNYLAQGEHQPGDRLPTLHELKDASHLNLSVSKIREQLEVARALGIVDVRSKAGMHLKPFSFTPAVSLSLMYALATDIHNFELFGSLRIHIETAYWHEAVNLMQPEDYGDMRQQIDEARRKLSNPRWIQIPHDEHRNFHMAVFKRLDNPFVTGLLEAYWEAYKAVELNRYADYTYHQNVWNYHEQILERLEANAITSARELFIEHTRLLRVQMPATSPSEDKSHHLADDNT